MKTWQDEVKQAVEAGEREFGPLDGHQTPKHNLVNRCEEILRLGLTKNQAGSMAASESD